MKPSIKNPVTNSPWATNMPNNFRGSQVASKKPPEPNPIGGLNTLIKTNRRRQPSKKIQITQIYVDQLVPLYPFLSKAQVRAAVILADNDLHRSRLLMDLTNTFTKVPAIASLLSFHLNRPSGPLEEESSMGDGGTTAQSSATVAPLSGYKKPNDALPGKGWLKSNSFSVSDNSNLSVYDFSDTEYNSEPIQSWSSHKKQNGKKIGVSIIKNSKGYRAFLL